MGSCSISRKTHKFLFGSFIAAALWLGAMRGGGQTDRIPPPLLPQNLRSTFQPVGARALALGGAFVSVADDSTAGAWNPAGVTQLNGWDMSLGLNLGSEDLSVNALDDLVDDVKDSLSANSDAVFYQALQRYARRRGEQISHLYANPILGLGGGQSISISAFGHSQAGVLLRDWGYNPGSQRDTTSFQAGALAIGYGAVSYGFSVNRGTRVGVSLKTVQAFYHPYAFDIYFDHTTQEAGDTSDSSQPYNNNSDDSALTLDVGVLTQKQNTRTGFVIRNVTSPRLRFDNPNRLQPGQPARIAVDLEPEVDCGSSWFDRDETASFEVHNLTSRNGRPFTCHFGYERRVNDWLALRGGINDKDWVGGLGLRLGPLSLDATVGPHYARTIAIGGRLEF